jgi:phosphatidylinositol alpha-1,6-mannosyltransferase
MTTDRLPRTLPSPARARKPKVLFACSSLEPGSGGIQRVARMMARVLHEDFSPHVAVRTLSLQDTRSVPDVGQRVQYHKGSRLGAALAAMMSGCTHLVTDSGNLAQLQWLPGLRKKPVLAMLHGIDIWEDAKPRWVRSAKATSMPVFVSDYSRRRAESAHGRFINARVCWNGTEANEPAPPALRASPPEVLIVGRMEEGYKGHGELIATWPKVLTVVPGAILRVVGRGPEQPELEKQAAAAGVGSQVVFDGFVPDDRLDELFARASVLAMPSRGEGFGIVYIEAMRHGLPIITSRQDAGQEVVVDGQTGYAVDLETPGQLADRLIRLLNDQAHAVSLGEAGRRRWAEHFRFSAFRERMRAILAEFLGLSDLFAAGGV